MIPPLENAGDEPLPHLTNGRLVVLSEMGHSRDAVETQPGAFRHLAETLFLEGAVDDSRFRYEPMNFTPSQSAPELAKKSVRRFALMGGGAVVLLIIVVILMVWLIKKRKRKAD